MSVPKKKRTKGSIGKRNAHSALKSNQLNKCPNCGQNIVPHQACPDCGHYKGRDIKKKKITKTETKASK